MNTLTKTNILVVAVIVFAIGTSGCIENADKCTQAIDNQVKVSLETAKSVGEAFGGPADPEKWKELEAEMERLKSEAIKRCQEALRNDKEGIGVKALDCVIAAKGIKEIAQCENADRFTE